MCPSPWASALASPSGLQNRDRYRPWLGETTSDKFGLKLRKSLTRPPPTWQASSTESAELLRGGLPTLKAPFCIHSIGNAFIPLREFLDQFSRLGRADPFQYFESAQRSCSPSGGRSSADFGQDAFGPLACFERRPGSQESVQG